MLLNTVTLKPGGTFGEVEMTAGELCTVVKETYGGGQGKFIAREGFKFSHFGSNERPLSTSQAAHNHYAIVTYWHSFNAHERSHANDVFKKKFEKPAAMCSETKELGYDML